MHGDRGTNAEFFQVITSECVLICVSGICMDGIASFLLEPLWNCCELGWHESFCSGTNLSTLWLSRTSQTLAVLFLLVADIDDVLANLP